MSSLTFWSYISLRCTKFCGSVTWKLKQNFLGEWRDVKGMGEGGKGRVGEAMTKRPHDMKNCVQWICAQKDSPKGKIRIILYLYQFFAEIIIYITCSLSVRWFQWTWTFAMWRHRKSSNANPLMSSVPFGFFLLH